MTFEKDSEREVKREVYNDPHHPDHPRNRDKDCSDKQEEELKESREQTHGGDPHHPEHPRNRK